MRPGKLVMLLFAALLALPSCDWISDLIHDDEVVAKLGKKKLYRDEIRQFIPAGTSPEDSTNLALQYINTWAVENLSVGMANTMLSKSELDVSKELEEYRNSLLKYRYEQHYVNSRLDTVVTDAEIEEYYKSHLNIFKLDVPIVKARFLDVMKASPNVELMRKKMSSEEYADLMTVDSLAYSSAIRYEDRSDEWESLSVLARYFDMTPSELLAQMDRDGYIDVEYESGEKRIAYVCSICRPDGNVPVEYFSGRIKDIIISNRKHELLTVLERDLLKDALDRENLIIY